VPEWPDVPPAGAVDAQRRVAQEILDSFLAETDASLGMVVDHAGQIVLSSLRHEGPDTTIVASLSAAQFAANRRLASLVGEPEFRSLLHQGSSRSVFMAGLGGPAIFVAVFREVPLASETRLRAGEVIERLRDLVHVLMPTGFAPGEQDRGADTEWAQAMEREIERVLGEGA
jgi:predicted regulator of Ras-like GTPase activity (Roadblock/LC7/MglB family)